jgi:orotidine-5'-phosphate decarboxylase
MLHTPHSLSEQIRQKRSFLCVGLDPDPDRIPKSLQNEADPVLAFNREIIAATKDFAIAYKLNTAFFEVGGVKGWKTLEKTLEAVPEDVLVIADAKRGDIGNTSRMYARTFFETMNFDGLTVVPYMGKDSVEPFLEFENKWVFLLALTSNPGAQDFQWMADDQGTLYRHVIRTAKGWAEEKPGNLGFVVGATRKDQIAEVRALAPDSFLLVPGVGAQGGDLEAVCKYGRNEQGGLLVNSSRGIIFAGSGPDFADKARDAAYSLQQQMSVFT